jgi:hypothetical protein
VALHQVTQHRHRPARRRDDDAHEVVHVRERERRAVDEDEALRRRRGAEGTRAVDIEHAEREAADVGPPIGRVPAGPVREPELRIAAAGAREQAVARMRREIPLDLEGGPEPEVLLAVQGAAAGAVRAGAALELDELLAVALEPGLFVGADLLAPRGAGCLHAVQRASAPERMRWAR